LRGKPEGVIDIEVRGRPLAGIKLAVYQYKTTIRK